MVHTNDPCLRCLFCSGRMLQDLSLSLLQLLPICYICKISIALFLHVGLPWANNLHMLSCHTVLYCFLSAEMLSSDRAWGIQGILGFLSMLGAYKPQDSLDDSLSLWPNTSLSSFVKTVVKTTWVWKWINLTRTQQQSGRKNVAQIMVNCLHFVKCVMVWNL